MSKKVSNTEAEVKISRGASNQRVARAGEYFVAAEINKRGAYAVVFAGNMPKIDLLACNTDQSRTIQIQVKTKRGGRSWHSRIVDELITAPDNENEIIKFWIFVNLGDNTTEPTYWIVPDWWINNDVFTSHQKYLEINKGKRVVNSDSKHHAIEVSRLEQWENKWEILKIF